MPKSRLSYVGVGLTSLEQLPDLFKHSAQIRTLCLHGNKIAGLQGIEQLSSLIDINVSSNEIQYAHSLQALTALVCVNLASNRLQDLEGLHVLPNLERLTVSHNMISSTSKFAEQAACRRCLKYLDLQNNQLTSLEELAAFKSFANLRHLRVSGGHPGNPVCSIPDSQHITLQMLPQLETCDGHSCSALWAQHQPLIKSQQQHQWLPPVPLLQQLQQQPQRFPPGPVLMAADASMYSYQPLALPAPAPFQQARPSLPAAAGTGLVQAKASQRPLHTDASHNQDHRIAALESRLRDVVNMRSRPPLASTENLLHQPLAVRKVRPKAVVHEVACQTATSMAHLDRLHHDAAHLKEELQGLASELDKRTSHALRVEEQAEALVQQAEEHANQQVSLRGSICWGWYAVTHMLEQGEHDCDQ